MSTPQFDKMEHKELTDYVVAVCLGETKAKLPPAQKLMGLLGVDEPIATAQITNAVEIEHVDAETITYYLAGHSSPKRCKAIADGAKLTAKEKKHVVKVATKREFESGTFGTVEYFRVTDSKGRSVYFSAQSNSDCGSWTPSSGHEGPIPTIAKGVAYVVAQFAIVQVKVEMADHQAMVGPGDELPNRRTQFLSGDCHRNRDVDLQHLVIVRDHQSDVVDRRLPSHCEEDGFELIDGMELQVAGLAVVEEDSVWRAKLAKGRSGIV